MNPVLKIVRQIVAPITDHQWDIDGFKIGGFACFGLVGWVVIEVVKMAERPAPDVAVISVIAGLATVVVGMGTTLFGMARKNDSLLIQKEAQP